MSRSIFFHRETLFSLIIWFLYLNISFTSSGCVPKRNNDITVKVNEDKGQQIIERNLNLEFKDDSLKYSLVLPNSFRILSRNSQTINLKGDVLSLTTVLLDTANNASIEIIYHTYPNSIILYKYAEQCFQDSIGGFSKNNRKVIINKHTALISISDLMINGKGSKIEPIEKQLIISLLDNNLGEFEIRMLCADTSFFYNTTHTIIETFYFK